MTTGRARLYIGQMSGTSFDGSDLALVSISESPTPSSKPAEIAVCEVSFIPYDQVLIDRLIATRNQYNIDHRQVDCQLLSDQLTELYAEQIRMLLDRMATDRRSISAIGLHGQTIWHQPPQSVQLGDPAWLAGELAVEVVGDVRQADLALGGQGAPIMPAIHHLLWGDYDGVSVVVNLGGIANATVIADRHLLFGYDIGPGNTLLDAVCRQHFSRPYDERGRLARAGRVHRALLDKMLSFAWFDQRPPRSTDQNVFNTQWLNLQLADLDDCSPVDQLCTLTKLTAESLSRSLAKCGIDDFDRLILCGSGCRNQFLVESIASQFPHLQTQTSDDYGYPSDYIEAIGMAWLAHNCLIGRKLGIWQMTGAREDAVFGNVYRP